MVQTGFMQLDQMDDAVQFVRSFFLEIAAVTSATPEKQKGTIYRPLISISP
jgi:hypothetical protein